ncbi:hypothetical protein BUALT_Bualt19G0093800 [Buddleja alternifolia]|uniref:non-specific serine/threonine protein kinase n=1 Tax=Buddleja alternifolia TaxID=168488 RepID=A0AAV6WB00_9LAMI|nr:hypothetical protein BUALT_Bualt19G0093800 [Buddleja alternifolia]
MQDVDHNAASKKSNTWDQGKRTTNTKAPVLGGSRFSALQDLEDHMEPGSEATHVFGELGASSGNTITKVWRRVDKQRPRNEPEPIVVSEKIPPMSHGATYTIRNNSITSNVNKDQEMIDSNMPVTQPRPGQTEKSVRNLLGSFSSGSQFDHTRPPDYRVEDETSSEEESVEELDTSQCRDILSDRGHQNVGHTESDSGLGTDIDIDNWERLVGAVIKREELRHLALCSSIASSNSADSNFEHGRRRIDRTVGNSATGALTGAIAGALLFATPAIALALYQRRKTQDYFFDVPAEEDPEVHLGQLKRFSLRELQVASDNFSNKNILGRGGFGKVYKGRLTDGTLVAIKRLKEKRTQGGELQFQTEVEMIGMAVHRNLLRLRGFCMTPTERLLVYPYMANGSVASCLRELPESQPPLNWPIRKRIALGSARVLAYLHDDCDPKIIHGDVKAANILLDEDFEPVIGDFGLAKLMDDKDTHVTAAVCGTIGHIAPEYLSTGKISEKIDVFGYGVMLLELVTRQRAYDLARVANDVMLLDWVKGLLKEQQLETLVDADLEGNYIDEEVEELIQIALLCTQNSPTERPKMSEVVRMLEGHGLAERWEEWQKEEMLSRI